MNDIDYFNEDETSFGFMDVIQPQNSGLFISRGKGRHPRRIITSFELLFVIQGCLHIMENGVVYTVEENQVLILYPGLEHYGTKDYPPNLQYYWLHFATAYTGINFLSNQRITIGKLTTVSRPLRLKQLFSWYINDQDEHILNEKIAKLTICQILSEIEQSGNIADKLSNPANYNAKEVYSIINTRFAENISTKTLSEELHCNSDYLGRVFKKAYSCSITNFLHERRIRYAQQLLLKNTANINEVAESCGFKNAGYFRTVFKRIVGVSPAQFRNTISRIHINTE